MRTRSIRQRSSQLIRSKSASEGPWGTRSAPRWSIMPSLLLLLLLLLPTPHQARAQPRLSAGAGAESEELVRKAKQSYRAGRYAQAIALFEQVLGSEPKDSATVYNLARCHDRLGDVLQAVLRYEGYLEMEPEAEDELAVRKKIASLKEKLSRTHGRLRVDSEPPGALVTLPAEEERELGRTPLDTWLVAGTHLIRISAKDCESITEEVRVHRMSRVQVRVALKPVLRDGSLALSCSEAGARVLVNEVLRGTFPLPRALSLQSGRHLLRVEKEGFEPWERRIKVEAAGSMELDVILVLLRPQPPAVASAAIDATGEEEAPTSEATSGVQEPGRALAEPGAEADEAPDGSPDEPAAGQPDPGPGPEGAPLKPRQEEPAPSSPPSRASSGPSSLALVALGVGAAGLAAGLGGGWLFQDAESKAGDYYRDRREKPDHSREEYDRLLGQAQAYQVVANAGFGVAALGLGSGLLLWWIRGSEERDAVSQGTKASLSWQPMPAGAAMLLRW